MRKPKWSRVAVGLSVGATLCCAKLNAQTNTFPSSGNVGIGTATPTYALDLNSGETLRIEGGTSANDNNSYFSFGGSGTFGIDAPGVINGRFAVLGNGNVGIGTATPLASLDVNGTGGVVVTGGVNLDPLQDSICHLFRELGSCYSGGTETLDKQRPTSSLAI
jgi:hypothetical protein